jgi:hypothetical protein
MLSHDVQEKFPMDLEELITKPYLLGNATPDEWYCHLKNQGYNLRPLGDGRLEGLPYEQGGGFRVSWGGDRSLLFHPAGKNHHGNVAYWKLSAGEFKNSHQSGRRRFDLDGNETIT